MQSVISKIFVFSLFIVIIASCGVRKDVYYARKNAAEGKAEENATKKPKYVYGENIPDHKKPNVKPPTNPNFQFPLSINRIKFVNHAKTYIGVPYIYGGVDRNKGLDCSGFIYNVFLHFDTQPPRVSKDYTYLGKSIDIHKAKKGDIILFTSPSTHKSGIVGHMGIITETEPKILFIHSASGGNKGVMISEFKGYFKDHYVKTISLLK